MTFDQVLPLLQIGGLIRRAVWPERAYIVKRLSDNPCMTSETILYRKPTVPEGRLVSTHYQATPFDLLAKDWEVMPEPDPVSPLQLTVTTEMA